MIMTPARPLYRMTSWIALLCLMAFTVALSACGDNTSPTPSTSSSKGGEVVTITITEQTGGHDIYSFSPQTVTIKANTTIKWVNNSDENHLLASSTSGIFSASSMVPRSGSNDNTFQMTFTTAGTYSYASTLIKRENNQPEGANSDATGTITVTN